MNEPTPEMLAKLITDNLGLIHLFARRMNFTHANDIAQQACVGIMRSKTYDPSLSVGQFLHWQVRGAFAYLKKRENSAIRSKVRAPSLVVEPNQEEAAEVGLVRDKARSLPPKQRQVLELLLDDHTYAEAGAAMGMSPQGARQLSIRARDGLITGRIRGWGHGPRAFEYSRRNK
jgi:RNA polymerase sigma factor (sigma-70 family)